MILVFFPSCTFLKACSSFAAMTSWCHRRHVAAVYRLREGQELGASFRQEQGSLLLVGREALE